LARIGPKGWVALIGLALVFLVPTIITNDYYIRVAITMTIFTVLVMGFRLMVTAGEFNIAIPAAMAIGAYTSALLTTEKDWNWWPSMIVAGGMAAMVALIVGRITLRVKGIYFAILGFGLVQVIRMVWLTWPDLFGGTSGIANIPSPNGIGGWEFGSLSSFYYLGLCLALLTIFTLYRLEKSRYGLTLKAIGQADNLAESIGINVMRYKLTAFVIGAFFAGIIGAFFASMHLAWSYFSSSILLPEA
jgi:branched-chain amino acid transport system permease protein